MTLEELRNRFFLGMGRRLSELATELNTMADAESLMRKFHSLAGIAGTYGYDGVTEISRECELLCLTAMAEIRALTDDERGSLRAAVETLRSIVETSPAPA